jgi:excisionase family DNA binding protein
MASKTTAAPKPRSGRPLLDFQGAATYLGLKENFLRRLVAEKRVPHMKMSQGRTGRVFFDPDQLDDWIRSESRAAEKQGA